MAASSSCADFSYLIAAGDWPSSPLTAGFAPPPLVARLLFCSQRRTRLDLAGFQKHSQPRARFWLRTPGLNDNVVFGALDDGEHLRPFLLRYLKLVERLVQVVDEGPPLSAVIRRSRCESSIERPVYRCGPPVASPTCSVTRYLNPGGSTRWCASSTRGFALSLSSDHDPVDEIVDDGGDVVDAAESLVQRCRLCFHLFLLCFRWNLRPISRA